MPAYMYPRFKSDDPAACELRFDDVFIADSDFAVPVAFLSLFQESDRCVVKKSDAEYSYMYVAPSDVVRRRLDVMGISAQAAREAYEAFREDIIRRDLLAGIEKYPWEKWSSVVRTFEMHARELAGGFFFESIDQRLVIRALLESWDVSQVKLDISRIVHIGRLGKDVPLCDLARKPSRDIRSVWMPRPPTRPFVDPVVILGEGRSDIRVLRLSLPTLYPELTDYFGFFDHEGLSVDGGASYVIKFLQAFAAIAGC
jgi:hypothetical protein